MADNIRATPQNATLGAIANFLKQTYAPQRTQQMQGVMELLGVPALARTAERMSYGEPVTNINKANVPLLPADTAEAAMLAGPPLASMARRVGTNLVQTAPYVARDLAQSMTSPMRSYVVKPKGGNWLAGSVEKAIEPMRAPMPQRATDAWGNEVPNVLANSPMYSENAAVNRWLENKLAKYIRNEMGTSEDPIRALAEQDVLHYVPQGGAVRAHAHRSLADMPTEPTASSALARAWEDVSDAAILPGSYAEHTPIGGFSEDALRALGGEYAVKNPQAMAYSMDTGTQTPDLGFGHLVDELKNAINPASGLPENLRWKYQDLEKVTVPQAVQRVADINAWRAAQKAEADLMRAQNAATFTHKEYPEAGFRWVELAGKKSKPEIVEMEGGGWTIKDNTGYLMSGGFKSKEGAEKALAQLSKTDKRYKEGVAQESEKALEDALKYEGETMGHCVDGYCQDVLEGRSRIYSLRDKKGQPHVTIEVAPGRIQDFTAKTPDPDNPSQTLRDRINAERSGNGDFESYGFKLLQRLGIEPPMDIVQIKGKANRAPNAEYLPAVQDFVRSQNWGRVGDLQNTGLINVAPDSDLAAAFKNLGKEPPSYVTQEELTNLLRWYRGKGELPTGFSHGGLVQKYAAGGLVGSNIYNSDAMQNPREAYRFADGGHAGDGYSYAGGGLVGGANFPTYDFDPARIDSIVGELHAMNAG